MSDAYGKLMDRVKDVGRLQSAVALLEWDQETYMPPKGLAARAEQIALLSGMAHEQLVAEETRQYLDQAKADDNDFVAQTNLRETRRAVERKVNVPTELVKEIAHTSTLAREAWAKARAESKFSHFAPLLGRMLELKRREADCIGYAGEAYDALMDEFEPGATVATIEPLFAKLRDFTATLLERVMAAPCQPDTSVLRRSFPRNQQEKLARQMAEALGFDFSAGRADVSTHPFCTTIGGGGDVRITTRYMEDFLPGSLFGTLHETGHALYEQGLPREHRFTPMGESVSLGIHESQSRLWENLVGRSRPFWERYYPVVQELFCESLGDVSLDAFCAAVNAVSPSAIRVEADELTYNLHIVLRFEIERDLVSGSLVVGDVPAAWNERMEAHLGITPADDAQGCLQDIHWSMGAFGYFPTYALGNLYAAQFFAQARKDLPDLSGHIRAGEHGPLLNWLRENIHRHGQRYRAAELVERVTGSPLSLDPFCTQMTEKYSGFYDL